MGTCFGRCLTGKFRWRNGNQEDELYNNLVDENCPSENERNFIFRIMRPKHKKHSKFIDHFWKRKDLNNYSRLERERAAKAARNEIQLQCLDAQSLLVAMRDRGITSSSGFRPEPLTGGTSSPASSSLDLEWEHEYAANQSWLALPEEITINELSSEDEASIVSEQSKNIIQPQRSVSKIGKPSQTPIMSKKNANKASKNGLSNATSWSHISTPDSLEWDVDQEQEFKSEDDSLDNETRELLYEIEQLKNRVLSETGPNLEDNDIMPNDTDS